MSLVEGEGWQSSSDGDFSPVRPEVSFTLNLNAINFLSQSYPLEPDMLFGWRPKLPLSPIPLSYRNLYVDWLISYIHSDPSFKLVYLGQRHSNSVKVNQQYKYQWKARQKYQLNIQVLRETIEMVGRCVGLKRNLTQVDQDYSFSSDFEGGNLDAAIRVRQNEYDLFMRSDSNTRGHCNWFFFKVKASKKGTVKLNICNMNKKTDLYSKGLRPYINDGSGWRQGGQNVQFLQRYCRYGFNIKHHQLHFNYTFERDGQEIEIAYGIPYSFSQLEAFVKEIREQHSSTVEVDTMCQSLGGVSLPILTITDKEHTMPKKTVLITARMHPGESVSSHMLEGFIRQLLYNPTYKTLLRSTVFRIVPMMNPDGVILGNFRTSYSGKDLNRQFNNLNSRVFPEVEAINQLASQLKNHYKKKFEYYFDFHGHSTKTNLFCYGPEHSKSSPYYLKARAFAKLLDEGADGMFSYNKSIFTISEHKKSTSRANMLLKIGIPMSYTFELSNGIYLNRDRETKEMEVSDMHRAGRIILEGFDRFNKLNSPLIHQRSSVLTRKQLKISDQSDPKAELVKSLKLRRNSSSRPKSKNTSIQDEKTKKRPLKHLQALRPQSTNKQINPQLLELINRVKEQRLERQDEGGSDSQDEIEDLEATDLATIHKQILNRQIKYDGKAKETEVKPTPHAFRSVNKENEVDSKKTVPDLPPPPPRQPRQSTRSVTARIRKNREVLSQEKYLLVQKNFVMEI